MVVRQPRYSKEEFAQRGDRWYETQCDRSDRRVRYINAPIE